MSADQPTRGRIGDRFPTNEQIFDMVRAGNPLTFAIPGEPRVSLFVSEGGETIGLDLPPGDVPDSLTGYAAFRVKHSRDGGKVRVFSSKPDLFPEFARLLATIAERVQIDRLPTGRAIVEALDAWHSVTERGRALAIETEMGLLGELWTLWRLISGGTSPAEAVRAWRGSESEEHDFGLSRCDLEVKATASEHRIHTISGLSQLVPTGARPLSVISIQFTAAGTGGHSLKECISLVRDLVPSDTGDARARFDHLVALVEGGKSTLLERRWRLRSEPRVVPVGRHFPRLTLDSLDPLPQDVRTRILELWYKVNLDGLGFEDGTPGAAVALGARLGDSPWT